MNNDVRDETIWLGKESTVMHDATVKFGQSMNKLANAAEKLRSEIECSKRTKKINCALLGRIVSFIVKTVSEAAQQADVLFQCQKSFQDQVGNMLFNVLRGTLASNERGVPVIPMQFVDVLRAEHGMSATRCADGQVWDNCDHLLDVVSKYCGPKRRAERSGDTTDEDDDDDANTDTHVDDDDDRCASETRSDVMPIDSASAYFGTLVDDSTRERLPPYLLDGQQWLCRAVLGDEKFSQTARAFALGSEDTRVEDGPSPSLSNRRDGGNAGVDILEMRRETQATMRKTEAPAPTRNSSQASSSST